MLSLPKAIGICSLAGLVGVILILLCFGLEEGMGLNLLYALRGPRPVPDDVMVVTLDRTSAQHLKLPEDVDEWPRTIHARLTETLAQRGAAVIAFDLVFEEPRGREVDEQFSQAIRRAGNVVLCEYLVKEARVVPDSDGSGSVTVTVEQLISPIPPLAQSAAAVAPFPLPKEIGGVNEYWMVKTSAGDIPTLPVAAFQVYALPAYEKFYALLKEVAPSPATYPFSTAKLLPTNSGAVNLVRSGRAVCRENPQYIEVALQAVQNMSATDEEKQTIRSLVSLYCSDHRQYLNFYGPPGTVPTVSYADVLRDPGTAGSRDLPPDAAGKAIFVGLSELFRADQDDDFHTVFSQQSGVYLSGVEIAATAFANLVEDSHIKPISRGRLVGVLFLWGIVVGGLCRYCSWAAAGAGALAVSGLYLLFAYHQFSANQLWYPIIVPLGVQTPLVFFGIFLLKYVETNRERQAIKEAFRYYLPADVVDQVAGRIVDITSHGETVYGACLSTDAEYYTAVAETMEPHKLKSFMNDYYEAVFRPVRKYHGIVSDVVGDSMLALWTTAKLESEVCRRACDAALEIVEAVDRFHNSSYGGELPTRIGVHFGEMLVGHVGAVDHYEYRAVGDCISTVSRIEGLNKHLGTRILVSQEAFQDGNDLLARKLGSFLLRGKSNPLVVFELMGRHATATAEQKSLCSVFAQARAAFNRRAWDEASALFKDASALVHSDGPSQFYQMLCSEYALFPPREPWDGVVKIVEK